MGAGAHLLSKAYVTSLAKGELGVIDMARRPFTLKRIAVPDCKVGEDVVFSNDNKTWYLSCMGSANVVMGDAGKGRANQNDCLERARLTMHQERNWRIAIMPRKCASFEEWQTRYAPSNVQ